MNENTYSAFEIMAIGMMGIIAVMTVFYGIIILIDTLFPPKETK
jgi:hypothetical protein